MGKDMEINKFAEQLKATGGYDTPPDTEKTACDRLFGRFDWWFNLGMIRTFYSGNRFARRGEFTSRAWCEHAFMIFRYVEKCGGRISVRGAENFISTDEPFVFVANHMSMLETMVLPGILLLFRDVTIVVKQSLFNYPLFGKVMHALKPISVTRVNPREDLKLMLNEGTRSLKNGTSVIMFPQSTRSSTFIPEKFNTIGVKLAQRAGVRILPVALKTDFEGVGRILRDFGPIDRSKKVFFSFGKPLSIENNRKETHRETVDFIRDKLTEWEKETPGE